MKSKQIYERIMMEYYFNKMKHFRDRWSSDNHNRFPDVSSLIDIAGEDHRQYKYIMSSCSEIVFEMLGQIIKSLLKEYKIPVKYYDLRTEVCDAYYVGNDKHWKNYIDQHEEKRVLAFSRTDKRQGDLYIFKEFGIGKRIPKPTLDELMRVAELEHYCYISYVKEEAFSEVINHNKDKDDPTRGTGIFSFKQFMEGFFGRDEYDEFKKYADLFSEKIRDYFGFALVRTLKPNAIHSFKKTVREDIKHLTAAEIGAVAGITDTQRDIIEKNFFGRKNYELLLGSSDFAQSYMTAEWLFTSLSNAGNIDFTAVAMGYFKSIEQLLFSFLKNHTHEKDGASRRVYVGKDKAYADASGCAALVDDLVEDEEKSKNLTLGSLSGFFGYHDLDSNRYIKRNKDLLVSGVTESTYEFIIDTLGEIVGLRNGYFHKDNLKEWEMVKEARQSARLVFYIILGAYSISEDDKVRLGLIRVDEHDDFYKLCEYVNRRAYESTPLAIPIVYVNDSSDPYAFGYPYRDDYIEYDNYGEPIYSGTYFKQFGKDGRIIKVDRDHLPKEIWEGELVISETIPIKVEPSGAQRQIFCNGRFIMS